MKKLICLLTVLLLVFTLSALAEENEWTFDADYCELSGYSGAGGDVVVPSEMDGSTVDVIQSNALSNMDAITALTLPNTLLQLRDSAICWDENLAAVTLPDSLIAIGERNLYACPKLSEITIPAGVRFIGEAAFSYDESLRKIVFTGVCPIIESGCFTQLPEDAAIYVPDDQLDAYQAALTDADCTAVVLPSGEAAVIVDNNGFDEADFEFDTTTGTITKYTAYAAYLAIPETIDGVPVRAIGDNAFEFHYYLAVLELPEGLENIGERAFAHCETLQYVSFPDSLKTIGAEAFNGGYKAHALNLTNVESIGERAFCFSRITGELTLPEGLTSIGAGAFENSYYISELHLPSTLQRVGSRAFADCVLTYMALDLHTPIDLASDAFVGNDALSDLDLPWDSSIENRDAYAALMAQQCPDCTVWINNPESAGVAEYPNNTEEITTVENGVWTTYNGDAPDLSIWSTYDEIRVSALGDGLFKDSQTIRSFYPHHCGWFTTIGREAFEGSSVEYVELFPSITTIGERAFANCANLEELTIPKSVTEIGAGAFEGLTGLKKLTVLCDASLIPEGSFADCPNLSDVRLAANATDEQIAKWNEKLGRPWYDPILREGEVSQFIRMPFEPTSEENFEFSPETGLISAYTGTDVDVVVPREIGGVTVVGFENDMVFEACRDYTNTETASNQTDWVRLRTLVLPETIREFPDGLFNYCQQLESFVCYAPVESTGKSTFALCRSLKTVAFMNGVRVIDSYAFDSTDSLENLYFGAHVQKIASNAFNHSGLKSFVVDAEEIETGAFTACPNLTSLHLTAKVKTIGETFVMECPNLSELCFDGPIANSLLLFTAAPQLTVRVAEDADENTRNLAQNCMSWSEAPSEITVTAEKCAHALSDRPDAPTLLPELTLAEGAESAAQETTAAPEAVNKPALEPEAAAAPQSAAIPEEYLGAWYGVSMEMDGTVYPLAELGLNAMLMIEADGTVTMIMDGETEKSTCFMQDGVLTLDGAALAIEDNQLIYAQDGMVMTLSHEKPEAAEAAPIDESATLDSFKGMWTAVKVTADGSTIPAESADMGGDTLTIYGDSCDLLLSGSLIDALPCRMDGSALLISILGGEFPATIRTDGTLAFELDDMMIWYERAGDAPAQPKAPDDQATERPSEAPAEQSANSPAASQDGLTDLTAIAEIRFVMSDADMNGYNMTPEALGGYEYSLVFHENGTVDFIMADMVLPTLKYAYGKVSAADGGEIDGIIIDFSGQPLNVAPTEKGLDLDYFGTMLMHFVPEGNAN